MEDDGKTSNRDGWIEVVIAAVLSIAGLATSWSSYQASLWDGEQAAHYSRANALRVMASRAQLEADAQRSVQIGLFNSWLQAKAHGDDRLADFYQARFPADLRAAFDLWIAQAPLKNPAAPQSPFTTAAYRPAGFTQARQLDAQADQVFNQGQEDNRISDVFTRGTVFLAMGLFFAGIGQVFKFRFVRLALLVVAIAACAVGIGSVALLPTLSPG